MKQATERTTLLSNGLIWFGAAVSIAEILTGTYFSPLGIEKGLLAIVIGHIIGGFILFGAGYIGAKKGKTAMETVKDAFGTSGSLLFIILNIIQLIGWTSIMIYDGSLSANSIINLTQPVWACIIGLCILGWLRIGLTNFTKINGTAMGMLFALTLVLCGLIANQTIMPTVTDDSLAFSMAIELSIAMPLSWLPLISDYTHHAKEPVKATVVSVIIYSLTSTFMYCIGMCAAIYTGVTDIAVIMSTAGLGLAGLLIVIFSTVTTTFLDAYSAGVSGEALSPRIRGMYLAGITTIIGTIAAMLFPMDDITNFLYAIGSVFAPMTAVLIMDYLLNDSAYTKPINVVNMLSWVIGFIIYRYFLATEFVLGSTLPAMVLTALVVLILQSIKKGCDHRERA